MVNEEQKELAGYVKEVHLSLRRKSRQIGAEKAWEEHLKNEQTLRKYAFCMKKLAEDYWSVNNSQADGSTCRIEWIVNCIVDYFQNGGLEKELDRERKKIEYFLKKGLIKTEELFDYLQENPLNVGEVPLKVLDVGSCYNPFKKFPFLEVFPIDLCPASLEVKRCNFIETEVTEVQRDDWFCDDLLIIPQNFFDVVVFCLFLEYLPSPKQRYLSFVKAYNCLKPNGLLLIVTPDSKHATANAPIIKKWKIAAACIGFVRIRLEKLKYLHCMSFKKSTSKYPLLLNNVQKNDYDLENMIIIPQDSVEYNLEEETPEKLNKNEDEMTKMFGELPFLSSLNENVELDS